VGTAVTRIVAGSVGGRRIGVPRHGVRPTSERVREALFGALDAEGAVRGAAVLDLCAGSGALGLEALSRGASHALFVESDKRVAGVLRDNLATLGLTGGEVRPATAASVLAGPAPRAYDLLLADPPYAVGGEEVAGWLRAAAANGWLAPGALVVLERPTRAGAFGWPEPLRPLRERRYGDTTLHLGYLPDP
jgi:16S rRNA (guanine966-N2)-methyltransferase